MCVYLHILCVCVFTHTLFSSVSLLQVTKAATPVLNRVPSQDIFGSPLDTLSPLNVEYNGHRFSAFEADVEAAEQRRKVSQNELIPASKHVSSIFFALLSSPFSCTCNTVPLLLCSLIVNKVHLEYHKYNILFALMSVPSPNRITYMYFERCLTQ